MENTFMLDFSNTVGGFMTGITGSTDLFTATVVIILFIGFMLILISSRTKNSTG